MLNKIFTRAKKRAFLKVKGKPIFKELISQQTQAKLIRKRRTAQTSDITPVLQIYK